jgi:hypothetical protein
MDRLDGPRTKAWTIALVGGVIVAVVMLLRIPLVTVFSFGVLLICPLLMIGMHRGQHAGDNRAGTPDRTASLPDAASRAHERRPGASDGEVQTDRRL